MRRSVRATALLAIAALVVINLNVVTPTSSYFEEDSLLVGPYVDEIIYKVIANQDQRVLALQAGEIDMDTSFFDPVYLSMLESDPDISVYRPVRNGYGHITINCAKYPLNISGFRRAFAFAFDKTRVTHESKDGLSLEHDSLVPHPNGWCAEDQFDWHYYTGEPEIGNQILDDLGFEIDGGSGFRLAPDGTPFEVVIEYSPTCCTNNSASIAVDALHSLHVDAHKEPADFNEYISRLDSHGDYDMVFYAVNFFDNSVQWRAYEYWSGYADVQYENPTNFRNATYDSSMGHHTRKCMRQLPRCRKFYTTMYRDLSPTRTSIYRGIEMTNLQVTWRILAVISRVNGQRGISVILVVLWEDPYQLLLPGNLTHSISTAQTLSIRKKSCRISGLLFTNMDQILLHGRILPRT